MPENNSWKDCRIEICSIKSENLNYQGKTPDDPLRFAKKQNSDWNT